jgi:hypothetical protein
MPQIIIGKKSSVHEHRLRMKSMIWLTSFLSTPDFRRRHTYHLPRASVGTSNDSRRIVFLVYDQVENQVGIVELKIKSRMKRSLSRHFAMLIGLKQSRYSSLSNKKA